MQKRSYTKHKPTAVLIAIETALRQLPPDQWCDRQYLQEATGRDPNWLHQQLKRLREQNGIQWKRLHGRGRTFLYRPLK